MFLFLRLLTAHFVGDFFLQTREIYVARKKGSGGATIHYAVIFLALLLFSLPYLKFKGTWVVIIFAALTHIVQDEIKLKFVPARFNFIIFILDQLLHILFLAPVLLFRFSYAAPNPSGFLLTLYNNNSLCIVITGYIASVFMGAYLWLALKTSYTKSLNSSSSSGNIQYGMCERFIITTSFLNMFFLPLFLIPLLVRGFYKRLFFPPEVVFNLIYASLIGLLLKKFLPIF